MSRDTLLPPKQLAAIVTALYADADRNGLGTFTSRRAHPLLTVGGSMIHASAKILTKYMTPEQARSWIKDGPMKEYANARRGTGRYARFGRQGGTDASDVAAAALGLGAKVLDGSEGVKPPHCYATDAAGERAYIAWGHSKNFRNLLWAALRNAVADQVPAHIVILEPPGHSTPTAESAGHLAMTCRCQLHLHYLPEVIGEVRDSQADDA